MLLGSMLAITLAIVVQRRFNRREAAGRSAVEDFARFEI
jgi:hypothetical protein